jgi:hypothetical protein
MMKIVQPLRGKAKTARFDRLRDTRAVAVTLGNHMQRPADCLRKIFDVKVCIFPERNRSLIKHHMNGVQPQAIDMILAEPI